MERTSKHKTWQPGIEKLYALRDFILTDSNGDEIGRATTFWLAVDMNKNRLIRPETYLDNNVFIKDYRALVKDPKKIPKILDSDHSMSFTVHGNNLDLNGHTNSIIYLKWIIKILKNLMDDSYSISEIEVNYISQSYPGDTIKVYSNLSKEDRTLITTHSLINEKNGATICNVKIKHKKY